MASLTAKDRGYESRESALTDDDYEVDIYTDDGDIDNQAFRLTMEEELQLQQEEDDDVEQDVHDTTIYTFLKRKAVVYPAETMQLLLNLMWCGSYVYLADRQFTYPPLLRGMMLGWTCWFVAFWIWKMIVKENRLKYMISLFAILDYLTLFPFFVNVDWINPLMSLRVMSLWRLFRVFPVTISPIVRSVLKLGVSILMLIFISAAFLLAAEPKAMVDFARASYFATVTISTVGYGDIHMDSDLGRLLVVLIILTAFIFIPWQGYYLGKIIGLTPMPWQRSLDVDIRKFRHVVLTGKITRQRISMFLREFLTPNNDNYRVVILDPEDQGAAFEQFIKDSGWFKRVRYYVGNPISDTDLARVHLSEAEAAFVWSDTSASSPDQADRITVLTCLALKSHSYFLKTYVEVILPESKARVGEVGPNMFVMSYQETKNGALSRACEVDALLSFCSILLTTFGTPSTSLDSQFGQYVDATLTRANTAIGHPATNDSKSPHFVPSPAQLAESALRRYESHETRLRASVYGRGGAFKVKDGYHVHGSHRSFHIAPKEKASKLSTTTTSGSNNNLLAVSSGLIGSAAAGAYGLSSQSQKYSASAPVADISQNSMSVDNYAIYLGKSNFPMQHQDSSAMLQIVPVPAPAVKDRPTLENAYKEYLWTRTCSIEIVVVPATFADRTFSEAGSSLYSTYGILLIGLRSMSGQLLMNPGPDYTLNGGEAAYIIGRSRDVRGLKQTFERMARDDGTTSHAKTLDFGLDARLEHSPFAPKSARKTVADDSYTQSLQAAAEEIRNQSKDVWEQVQGSHFLLTEPRTYQQALQIPEKKVQQATPANPHKFHTFQTTPVHGPAAAAGSGATGSPVESKVTMRRSSTGALPSVQTSSSEPIPSTSTTTASKPVQSSLNSSGGLTTAETPATPSNQSHHHGLTNHIIFCSCNPNIDWYALVKPLRSKLNSTQRAIVLVTPTPIDPEQWELLSYFADVWVVEGLALVASYLIDAQIEHCSTIVILSSPNLGESESMLDEKAIIVYNSVKAHFSTKRIFLDLAKPSNARLVAPEVGRVGIYENPEFIAGHIYDCSLHDTVMAKAFDTPFLMELVQCLLNCNDEGVSLVTIPCPEVCRGSHFETLFNAFPDCVPLGLLRRNPLPALRKFPYICICPPPTAVIGAKDQIFLLAPPAFMLRRAAREARKAAKRRKVQQGM